MQHVQLDEFLYNLHFDVDKVRPVDMTVDWADAPLPFKLYQGLPAVPLPCDSTSSIETTQFRCPIPPDLKAIGDFLWYSYGLTQLCHTIVPGPLSEASQPFIQLLRRYLPSGGGLYPSELYVYLKMEDLSHGIYHYDVAHHRLILLRQGNFDDYLERCLGRRYALTNCFATVFVSTMFWKNFYKYSEFSYRLQGLDAGVLIGQLNEVANACGYQSSVCLQFLDQAVNHLLGLSEAEESTYAVMPLYWAHTDEVVVDDGRDRLEIDMADDLCETLPMLQHRHYNKSKNVAAYPRLIHMNMASMCKSTDEFSQQAAVCEWTGGSSHSCVSLPQSCDLDVPISTSARNRFSPGLDFTAGKVSLSELATLMRETCQSTWTTDIAMNGSRREQNVTIAACVHGVEGLEDGAYVYEAQADALRLVDPGDKRMQLQLAMTMPTVNLTQVPLCVHLIGCPVHYRQAHGYRGYRMLQMEVGMVLQRLLLVATALGMAGHPLLGYEEGPCDDIYHLNSREQTCLVQVPIGRYRKRIRFEGTLR